MADARPNGYATNQPLPAEESNRETGGNLGVARVDTTRTELRPAKGYTGMAASSRDDHQTAPRILLSSVRNRTDHPATFCVNGCGSIFDPISTIDLIGSKTTAACRYRLAIELACDGLT